MKNYLTVILFFCSFSFISHSCANEKYPLITKIDFDWRFHLGDIANGEIMNLSTDNWRILDLPHDWSIEGEYSQNNGTYLQSSFLPAGIGWYRKTINWNPDWEGKLVKIYFEGIYLNSDVWINGHHLGHRPNGYIGFEYDLTPYLQKGENVIAVKVDHSKPLTGRWYTGSGIYRHVWLKVQNPLHIENWGIFFTTPIVDSKVSTYQVEVEVSNQQKENKLLQMKASLTDKSGKLVSETERVLINVYAGENQTVELKGNLMGTELWSTENPYLYTLQTFILENGKKINTNTQKVGFRRLEFSSEFGFKLNGEITKLKGVSDHHTAGPLGAAVPDDVWLFRLKLLKEMGCNAIRTAHNPFSPAFYNICDSIGMMVLNEFLDGWDTPKAAHDYGNYFNDWWEKDGTDFIKRDRNHPSIIMWSIGNEVKQSTREVQTKLLNLFHKYDPTRPVTQGGHDPTRGMTGDKFPLQLDIKGFNGDWEQKDAFENYHAGEPNMPVVGTELPHTYQTRGVYRTQTRWRTRDFPATFEILRGRAGQMRVQDQVYPIPDLSDTEIFTEEVTLRYNKNGNYFTIENDAPWAGELYYQSSYDNAVARVSDLPYLMGHFRWGSFDYLGESNDWPSRYGNKGVIDICGFPKDHFYLYQSMWTDQPMVHILPHWTHPGKEGTEIPVVAYTNCDEVELFLNGNSLGVQKYNDEQLIWLVPYKTGTIKAIARNNGGKVAEHSYTTAENQAKLELTPDKTRIQANRTDVVHIAVSITDKKGIFCPHADNEIVFEITGPVKIIGVDNGDPIDLSDYKTNRRKAFRGKVMLWIQSTGQPGKAVIHAKADKIKSEQIEIEVN